MHDVNKFNIFEYCFIASKENSFGIKKLLIKIFLSSSIFKVLVVFNFSSFILFVIFVKKLKK